MFAIMRFRYIEVLLHILYWFLPHKCIVLSKSADLVADFGGNYSSPLISRREAKTNIFCLQMTSLYRG